MLDSNIFFLFYPTFTTLSTFKDTRQMEEFLITKQSVSFLNKYNIHNEEVTTEINKALKRDYLDFNKNKSNYKIIDFNHLPCQLEIFTLFGNQYFIESYLNKQNEVRVHIFNYKYQKQWLKYLNQIRGNYKFRYTNEIIEKLTQNAESHNIKNIQKLSEIINDLFLKCFEFHSYECFEDGHFTALNILLESCEIYFWQQKNQKEFIEIKNKLFSHLQELFLKIEAYDFLHLKSFIQKSLSEIILSSTKSGFQWGLSPYKKDILNLGNKIEEVFQDKKIKLKWKLKPKNQIDEQLNVTENQFNEKNDDKTSISREEIERLKNENQFVNYNFLGGTNDFHQVKTNNKLVKIYTLELAQILCAENLNVEIISKGKKREKIVITNMGYFKSYETGYNEGQKYFDKTYTKNNIEDIRIKYNKDWRFAKNSYPLTFSQKRAKQYGYASGIISKIEDLQNEYPALLQDFFKASNYDGIPKSKETIQSNGIPNKKLKIKQIALIHVYNGKSITRENSNQVIQKYGHNSGESLFQKFTFYSSTTNRKGKPNPYTLKKLKNKIELLESVLSFIQKDKQQRALDEISILKNILELDFQ